MNPVLAIRATSADRDLVLFEKTPSHRNRAMWGHRGNQPWPGLPEAMHNMDRLGLLFTP